ncbi:hypothetical protein TrLO_g9550 [Triparma laevis f. longispina]|uniref:Uncharacterized protein n=1 Tax=Triparma laevis f. longispina TaxID=1714387 RepID=A0A9W7DQI5_9STRA|nr:hypothetical protein TrLO_g9550 [Triparma laevis f. longispina]
MIFFSFEAISCFISRDSLSNGKCGNASIAAAFLSVYLGLLLVLSIINKSVPKSVQRATAWELSYITTLNLAFWQRLQGVLLTTTAIASLYLLSVLAVEGDKKNLMWLEEGIFVGALV